MTSDVFGRPIDERPTGFPVNPRPLAPNPMDPVLQNEPFSGGRPPGDLGTERGMTQEFLGAQCAITATRPGLQDDHSFDWPQGSPGGKALTSATPFSPMPVISGIQPSIEAD